MADADVGSDRSVIRDFAFGLAGDEFQRADKAGGVAGGEQLIAAAGMFMSTTGGAVFAFVAICFAAIGFKSASSLFWPIPQGYLDVRIAAAVIALINSIVQPRRLQQAPGITACGLRTDGYSTCFDDFH